MAAYDLPATVDKVLEVSGADDLVYIGFSQGTQIAFARLSSDKQLSKKIRLFVALAPVAYLGHLISPLKYLAPFAYDLDVRNVKSINIIFFYPSGYFILLVSRMMISSLRGRGSTLHFTSIFSAKVQLLTFRNPFQCFCHFEIYNFKDLFMCLF